jgi:hypothetical protein
VIEKKKIESEKIQGVMTRLEEIPKSVLSARQFIIMYFDKLYALQQSGRSLKAIHQFLLANGVDVGTYESFRTVYRRAKRAQKTQAATGNQVMTVESEKAIPPEKSAPAPPTEEKSKNTEAAKVPQRPRGVGLRPIYLADGTEVEIDPETGAKRFKIKSNRRTEE